MPEDRYHPDLVNNHLEQIRQSRAFHKKPRLLQLLVILVEAHCDGKELLGTEVSEKLFKGSPNNEGAVKELANRLRNCLMDPDLDLWRSGDRERIQVLHLRPKLQENAQRRY